MEKSIAYENPFDALFNDPVVASNLKIRADLMIKIRNELDKRKLTQKEAAELLGISQPRVNYLMKAKIDRFSIDILVNMLSALGKNVTVKAA